MEFKKHLQSHLLKIAVPTSAISCRSVKCCNEEHASLLTQYISDIIRICTEAANNTMPQTDRNISQSRRRTPGWEEHAAPARHESTSWPNIISVVLIPKGKMASVLSLKITVGELDKCLDRIMQIS